jgi:hypothetical protein
MRNYYFVIIMLIGVKITRTCLNFPEGYAHFLKFDSLIFVYNFVYFFLILNFVLSYI